MSSWNYDPIIFRRRTEFVQYDNIPYLITKNRIFLQELPDMGHRVLVNGLFETLDFSPESGKFFVNYNTGEIVFNEDINNTTVYVSFFGAGLTYLPASRIYVQENSDGTLKTLQDFIDWRKLVMNRVRETYTTQVAATNGTDIKTFYAQAGHIARLKYIGINVPAIANSTGNHKLEVTVGTDVVFEEEKLFTRTIQGTSEISIKSEIDSGIYDIVFDETTPLQVKYTNNTNTTQAGTRFIYLIYEEEATISS